MTKTLLTLGSFSFDGLEVPDRIISHGSQRLVVQHCGAGFDLIDSTGTGSSIISFSGIFAGRQAASRIRTINFLKSQGAPVPLVWNTRTVMVIIRDLKLEYRSDTWIPYTITCLAISDSALASSAQSDPVTQSPSAQISDISMALSVTPIEMSPAQTAAVSGLASLMYDIAPSNQMKIAKTLRDSVVQSAGVYAANLDQAMHPLSDGISNQATAFNDIVATMGTLAYLYLTGARIGGVISQAESVGTP